MISRYTREVMGRVWSRDNRFQQMLKVEVQTARAQAKLKLIPKAAAVSIEKKARFSLKKIDELEKLSKHDVGAFIQEVSKNIGPPHSRWLHYGLTSSDVLDTALSLQIRSASQILKKEMTALKKNLKSLVLKHKKTLCAGRTHGMHAEPTVFGFKLLSFLSELLRVERFFTLTIDENSLCMISGPVGHYSPPLSPELETEIAKNLGLKPESVSTQVIPRDRIAHVLFSLCRLFQFLERLALELRLLQRTEVGEIFEGFSKKQQGSSSMPHKKNPISAENVMGLSRLSRSYLQAALENTALHHERDISHSSVERVILPDSFILCDYALSRMGALLKSLQVDEKKMRENLFSSKGEIFSSSLLLALVKQGLSREEAYRLIQKTAHTQEGLKAGAFKNKIIAKHLKKKDLENLFSGGGTVKRVSLLINKKLKNLEASL